MSKDCKRPKNISAVDEIEEDKVAEFEVDTNDSEDQIQGNVDA